MPFLNKVSTMDTNVTTPQAVATVIAVEGQAYARDPAGQMRPLKAGDVLREGDTVVTLPGGNVQLAFLDGQMLTLLPNEPSSSAPKHPPAHAPKSPKPPCPPTRPNASSRPSIAAKTSTTSLRTPQRASMPVATIKAAASCD